ncbi:hypothetical protein IW140_002834 [Coemansia sp. RSA 1813]|nr:hypothetical protein EV178_002754 [Coemansia sp. RSA 1646]KAJ1770112.1 hypothetical protein LPJ74_003473 [Coemansia sp. RSA 1843]KAJ2089849.1 hypothetical protein IW138_003143 [Coemansia sp. RSA 986]KAJ2214766.1 hypothetical protein EV179_002714 [Coemansia sp. RSA 487]KAJ2569753.1 hypothetical protein IW140_002834 [Coemansia sp. RSA 1813]
MTESPEPSRKRPRVGRRSRHSESSTSASTQPMMTRSQALTLKRTGENSGADTSDYTCIDTDIESPGKRKAKCTVLLHTEKEGRNEGGPVGVLSDSGSSGDHEGVDDLVDADSSQDDIILTSKYIGELAGDQEIVAKLGLVFSDPCTLARSFPQANPRLAASCPVDVEDVRRAYAYMKENTPEKVMQDLRLLTISAVAMMSLDPCDEHDNQMNAVLIILLNPCITEYAHDDNTYLLPELCSVILNQPSEQRSLLMRYFAAAEGSAQDRPRMSNPGSNSNNNTDNDNMSFTQYINIFQSFVTRETNRAARNAVPQSSPTSESTSKKVCLHSLSGCSLSLVAQCLALMNSYNNTHSVVPHYAFYNDAVNEHIDTKEEVPRFRMPKGVSFCSYPFLLSPTTKSEIIRIESMIHMRTELQDSFFRAMFSGVTCPYLVLEVRRDSLVRDTLYQLDLKMSQDLRKQLKVRFVGEEGVDEGGVQKEFFQLIVRDVFSSKYGIFKANSESQYHWFLSQTSPTKDMLEEIWLTGQLIGLAVYNGVILDIHLPPVMYKKLLGMSAATEDLREIDPELYHGLTQLLRMSDDELSFLDRTFEIEYDDLGHLRTHELIPDGASTVLTAENRELFIDKYVDFILNKSCAKQFAEFKGGFDRICGLSYVRYMQPQELELLVCGCSDLDFGALENSTVYDGGYSRSTKVIEYFWQVVGEFGDELKRKLLFFATSSDRVPIGGLSKLQFVIAKNGGDSDRLPTSHTCFNVLLLPEYSSLDKLRERLLTAIHNSEGFGMI